MKIAIIVSTFPPYFGGIGNVALENARELARRGHSVTVFTPHYSRGDERTEIPNITVRRLRPWFRYGNAAFLPQLFFMFKDFDVVHLHYPFFGGAEVVALAKRCRKRFPKLFFTYHMDVKGKGFLKWVFAFHTRYIMPWILRSADGIAVTSVDYAEHSHIQKMFREQPERFCVIPNGVDTNHFTPEKRRADFFSKYGVQAEDKVLLFVGGLDSAHYFKGLSVLLPAMQVLDSDVKLVIVGEGDLRKSYEAEADTFGITERVKFLGRVPAEDLPAFFASADVTILPSVDASEAFGMVLVESLASGTPVIASDLPGVRSVVESGRDGLLTSAGDVGALVVAIEEVLRDPERRKTWGEYGRKVVKEKYDWKVVGERLEELMRR